MSTELTLYEMLELLPTGSVARARSKPRTQAEACPVVKALRAVGACLIQCLAPSEDPQIERRPARGRAVQFAAYDPASRQHYTCAHEDDLRVWLERRYYVASKYGRIVP